MRFSVGNEFHTFTIVGRCVRTGMIGIGITTSDIAVGSRCPYVKPSVGAVSTQADTNPRLGPFALRLLELGYSPDRVIQKLEANDTAHRPPSSRPHRRRRRLRGPHRLLEHGLGRPHRQPELRGHGERAGGSAGRPGHSLLATSKSGTLWDPRDQALDGGLVSSLRALL